jgi:hypothetical protein
VRFDGVDDKLSMATTSFFKAVGGGTIFLVGSVANTTAGRRGLVAVTITAGSFTRSGIFVNNVSGTLEVGGRRLDADSNSLLAGGSFTANQKMVVAGLFDFANSDLFLFQDGVLKNSNTSFQTDGVTSNTDATIEIGAQSTILSACDIAAVLMWERKLTASELAQMFAWSRANYGTP